MKVASGALKISRLPKSDKFFMAELPQLSVYGKCKLCLKDSFPKTIF